MLVKSKKNPKQRIPPEILFPSNNFLSSKHNRKLGIRHRITLQSSHNHDNFPNFNVNFTERTKQNKN